ncbi:Carbohydrate acetyl esterase/feruloyl esterase [Arenibacter antarcticus]|uniref:Sialate O-acetylesterase n=1 Tax=Arenibacter antarcticus TaxID=2040469 RepID=A0ABW5VJU2_9FLAO|nr:sialate O-acetylesterase [Arenibacter sp. H213]MCM4167132.1 sialate O-acetylesterase [Arenibacter sp. H213]
MNVFRNTLLFLLLLQINQFVTAQIDVYERDSIPAQTPKNLDIYLVIGQSNMAGRATIRKKDKVIIEHSYLFKGDDTIPWSTTSNPLNRYSTVRKDIKMQGLSPAFSFVQSMAADYPKNEIGLVMNARGGTKIVQWLPGTKLYLEAIKQTHKSLKYGKLKGVIWHQGEGDSDPLRLDMYLGRLEILINAIREEFDDPTIPFIAGQLYENEDRHAFNEMILQLPDFIKGTGVVSSKGTNTKDGTHFDSESIVIMGHRYAAEMKKLQLEIKSK